MLVSQNLVMSILAIFVWLAVLYPIAKCFYYGILICWRRWQQRQKKITITIKILK